MASSEATKLSAPMSFAIRGHAFKRATSANRVALYIGRDVFSNGSPFSRLDIALDVADLAVGESVEFAKIPFAGADVSQPVIVERVS